jgi:colanic acid/amylovoran biosynthesis glycosyltransferase
MGIPVVSFQHGGVPEAVVDGLTGLLAPEGDVAGLAERILCYLGDAAKRIAAGAAGRLFVQEHFSLERRTKELEKIYDGLVAEPTPTRLHA